MNVREALQERVLVFDGAMGTLLQARGVLSPGSPPELVNVKHPDVIREIHEGYVSAGSDIIETNTFGANRIKLAEFKLENQLAEIISAAVREAKKAARGRALVAGSMGPTGLFVEPVGDLSFDDAVEIFTEVAEIFLNEGVDLFNIETMMDVKELRAAVVAIRQLSRDIPVFAMMTFQEDMRTVLGTTPEAAGVLLNALPVDVIGANCSLGPDGILEALIRMAPYTSKPLIFQPNAGLPVVKNGVTVYPAEPRELSSYVEQAVVAGARVIAGCCGTTPEHVKALRSAADSLVYNLEDRAQRLRYLHALSSRTNIREYGKKLMLIGERLNPTGKKHLIEALRAGDISVVREEARKQTEAGAHVLDVNVSIPGADEVQLMKKVVHAVNVTSPLPLSLDSSSVKGLEAGVKSVDGKPLLNSTTCEEEKFIQIIELAKLYGAAVVVLPLSGAGVPRKAGERLKLAEWAVEKARGLNFPLSEMFFDPIVLTVSSDAAAPAETLKTLRGYKQKSLYTIMGLSNVSFGLPARRVINAAFLAMAGWEGVDAVILNPLDKDIMDTLSAVQLLTGKDRGAKAYIERMAGKEGSSATPVETPAEELSLEERLKQAVIQGEKEAAVQLTRDMLEGGVDPLVIGNEHLVSALAVVGKKFAAQEFFLPQVMQSAEAVKAAFEVLRPALKRSRRKAGRKIVFATVEGDVHDIGKNIVITLLEANGFDVVDLGKNVKTEEIVRAVERERPDAVALSALMTTTMGAMKKVIEELRKKGLDIPVAVGGACVTPEFAREIGASMYAADALEAVKVFKEHLGVN